MHNSSRDGHFRTEASRRPSNIALILTVCASFVHAQNASIGQNSIPTFGTTVFISSGLRGEVYLLPVGTAWLPNFKRLKPVGTIYTTRLNIPRSDFQQGFPGITSRFEWFAIDYTGRFWLEEAGRYRFGMTSDDGSKLYLDDHLILDLDGIHPSASCSATVDLAKGIHAIRISYFQGPRWELSLILGIAKPGGQWRVFDTNDFLPPPEAVVWKSEKKENSKKRVHKVKGGSC